MKHFLAASHLALVIPAAHTAGAVDPAVVITVADPVQSSRAEPSGSSDGGPAAAAGLRRAVVVPDLLGATATGNGNRGDEVAVAADVGEEVAIATDLNVARPWDCWTSITYNSVRYQYDTSDMCRSGPIRVNRENNRFTYRSKPSSGWVWAEVDTFQWAGHGAAGDGFYGTRWECGEGGNYEFSEFGRPEQRGPEPEHVFVLYTWRGRLCWYK